MLSLIFWATPLLFSGGGLFEPNDSARSATFFPTADSFETFTQTHDVHSAADVDWVFMTPVTGEYFLTVRVTTPPPMGQHSLNIKVFGDDAAIDEAVLPLYEFNSCESAQPGGVTDADILLLFPTLYFVKIIECFDVEGGEYAIELRAIKLGSGFDPILLRGQVIDEIGTGLSGIFVLSDANASTFSLGGGVFNMLALAQTQNTLIIASDFYEADPVVVPPQPSGQTVSDLLISARLIDLLFANGFESP